MDSSQIIVWMIIGCIFFVAFVFFSPQLRTVAKMLAQAAVGCVGFLLFNFLLSGFGLSVGINFLTVFLVGALGAPGFVALYAAQLLL